VSSHSLVYAHDIVKTSAMDYSGNNQITWALAQVDDWPEQLMNDYILWCWVNTSM
jgi:hypothetical protein